MTLAERASEILGGDILLRLRADATGLDADVSSKLTAAERAAEQSASRVGASSARSVAAAEKVQVAQLRVTAAEERYNAALTATERNTARIASAEASLISARQRAARANTELAASQNEAAAATTRISQGLSVLGTVGIVAATVGLQKLSEMYHEGVDAAEQLEQVQRQTEVQLKSTGDAAGVSAEHVRSLADEMSRTSGVQDEVIQGAENVLLSYTAIQNVGPDKIFDRAAQAAEDLAVAYHNARGGSIDVATQARALGIALNDPASGMDRLRRSGVAFTAQQREQVKALTESGQTLKAQALILDLVNQKVGGSAAAYGKTAAGSAERAGVAYEDLTRSLSEDLLPVVTRVEEAFAAVFDHHRLGQAVVDIGLVGTGLVAVVAAERALETLRRSEVLSIGARLLGFRSLERAQVQLAAAEDRHAEAASRAAVAETELGAATGRTAATSEVGAATQAAESGAAAAGGGLLSRFTSGGALKGLAGLGVVGLDAYLIPKALSSLKTEFDHARALRLAGNLRQYGRGGSLYEGANPQQQAALRQLFPQAQQAAIAGEHGDYGAAQRALADLQAAYDRYSNSVINAADANDRELVGARALIIAHGLQRDAIAATDVALAESADRRAATAQRALSQARQFQRQVAGGDTKAVQAVEQAIGTGQASLFDVVPATHGTASASEQSSVRTAQTSAADAARRVQYDEQRLNTLRASGKTTALQLRSAEDALTTARERASAASDRVSTAEQKVNDAQKSSALSVDDILKRATAQVQSQQATAQEAHQLVRKGISEPVLDELYQLDQQAPGTFAKVAENMTKAAAERLNRDQRIASAARRSLELAFADSNTRAAKAAAAKAGTTAAQAWQQAYRSALRSPEFWRLLNTDLGRLLVGNQGILPRSAGPGAEGTGTTNGPTSIRDVLRTGLTPTINVRGNLVVQGATAAEIQRKATSQTRQRALSGLPGRI